MTPLVLVVAALAADGAPRQKVAVLDFATPGVEAEAGKAISRNLVGIVSAEVARAGYDVISSADIEAMLSYERKRDLLSCEDNTSCLAEIGGALGADLMVSGSAGKLGNTFNVSF